MSHPIDRRALLSRGVWLAAGATLGWLGAPASAVPEAGPDKGTWVERLTRQALHREAEAVLRQPVEKKGG